MARRSRAREQPALPSGSEVTEQTEVRDLVELTQHELRVIRAVAAKPGYQRAIEARDERIIESPFSLIDSFKSAAAALRVRLYHGATPASPPMEDFPSGTVRGRRAFLEGTPSATRLLMGVPVLGQMLSNWVVDVEIRVTERDGQVWMGVQMRTTLPQRLGHSLVAREFDALVDDIWRLQPSVVRDEPLHDPIVGPGQSAPESFTGTLRDYARCAAVSDLDALREGDFPIGRYLWPADEAQGSVPLYLGAPRDGAGAPTEHLLFRNVCVTAPVGSGKTYSIFRPWAAAAARAGFSTLVFDPKGDLAPAIAEPSFNAGNRVVVIGTSPEQPSVPWNFMDEVEIDAAGRLKSRRAVDAILDALLPNEAGGSGNGADRNAFAHQLYRGWLSGLIQIAKYALGDSADPSVLYAMSRDEKRLRDLLDQVKLRWPEAVYSRLYYEVNDLFDKFEWGYTAQLRGVANALQPFQYEPVRSRTAARPGKRGFRITDIDKRPTTLILACSLQDLEIGKRMGSIATALLLARVYERRPPPPGQHDTRIPILLLLDETRLLNVDLPEFLAIGRGFKAGVVTCYQEMDQIGDEARQREVLANCNTLIVLRGVGAGSRRALQERLAKATVQVTGVGGSVSEDRRTSETSNSQRVEVAVLGDYEIRSMPGPKHTAVVHIQDGTVPSSKPFLVDLTAPAVPAAHTSR